MNFESQSSDEIKINEEITRDIVIDYLLQNCYENTVKSLLSSPNISKQKVIEIESQIQIRKTTCMPIYNHILSGQFLKCIELTDQISEDLLNNNQEIYFDILTLHFVDLVKSNDCSAALKFAQEKLKPFGQKKKFIEKLQDCMALLAYEDPSKSPLFFLFSFDFRESVANSLHRALCKHFNLSYEPVLEKILKHAFVMKQVSMNEKIDLSGFNMDGFIGNAII